MECFSQAGWTVHHVLVFFLLMTVHRLWDLKHSTTSGSLFLSSSFPIFAFLPYLWCYWKWKTARMLSKEKERWRKVNRENEDNVISAGNNNSWGTDSRPIVVWHSRSSDRPVSRHSCNRKSTAGWTVRWNKYWPRSLFYCSFLMSCRSRTCFTILTT